MLLGSQQAEGRIPWRIPWYRAMRRCGLVNFNERDPETLNVSEWSSLKLDALLLKAGGIHGLASSHPCPVRSQEPIPRIL
jgi:hypothetical protein